MTDHCPTGCAIHDCDRCGAAHPHVTGRHACPSCGLVFPDLAPSIVSPSFYRAPREWRSVDPGPCAVCGMTDGALVAPYGDAWRCADRSGCLARVAVS